MIELIEFIINAWTHDTLRYLYGVGIVTLVLGVGLWFFEIGAGLWSDGTEGEIFSPAFPAVLLVFSFVVYVVTDRIAKAFDIGQVS